jgi:hypothetical protein
MHIWIIRLEMIGEQFIKQFGEIIVPFLHDTLILINIGCVIIELAC